MNLNVPRNESYDLVVVGAGAAGLLAASAAAERGLRVVLLEKNRKPGVKILMSGGTRCNLTQDTDARGIIDAFGRGGRFLHTALGSLDPEGLVRLFENEGVPTKVEATGKVFPQSDRAIDVLNALLRRVRRSGAELALGEAVESVEVSPTSPGVFTAATTGRSVMADRLLIATGGRSYPGCGTTGDGYAWAKQLGHSIAPTQPALVPLTCQEDWVHRLQGVTLDDVGLRLYCPADQKLDRQLRKLGTRGGFLFTHRGLSGPAVLDISRNYTNSPTRALTLVCDFVPDVPRENLVEQFRGEGRRNGKRRVHSLLTECVPKRLADEVLGLARTPIDRTLAEFSRDELQSVVQGLKVAELPITGTLGFAKAEVTSGGVVLSEVDSRTMQSKLTPGLFFAGEVLDLDGPIGGYNFQAAFSTGLLAAHSV